MIILVKMIMMMMVIFMKIWPPGAVRGPQGPQEGLLGPKWALRKSMDCSIDFAVCLESRICILVLGSTASWPCSIIYYLDFTFFFCLHPSALNPPSLVSSIRTGIALHLAQE